MAPFAVSQRCAAGAPHAAAKTAAALGDDPKEDETVGFSGPASRATLYGSEERLARTRTLRFTLLDRGFVAPRAAGRLNPAAALPAGRDATGREREREGAGDGKGGRKKAAREEK